MEKILIEVNHRNDSKLIHQVIRRMGYKARIIRKRSLEDNVLQYLIDEGIKSGLATENEYQAIVKKWT